MCDGVVGEALRVCDGAWPKCMAGVGKAGKIHDVFATDEIFEVVSAGIGMSSYESDEAPPRRGSVFSRGA